MLATQSYDSDGEPDPLLLFSQNINDHAHPSKRRRIQVTTEEIVDTSDAEEREELAAAHPDYLENALKRLKPFPRYSDYVRPPQSPSNPFAQISSSVFSTPAKPKSQKSPSSSRSHTSRRTSPSNDVTKHVPPSPLPNASIALNPSPISGQSQGPPNATIDYHPMDMSDHEPFIAANDEPPTLSGLFSPEPIIPPRHSTSPTPHASVTPTSNSPLRALFSPNSPLTPLNESPGPPSASNEPPKLSQHNGSPRPRSHRSLSPSSPGVPRSRNLRQRTAIQQNPYTIERLLYKSTLQRAGQKEAIVKKAIKGGFHSDGEDEDYEMDEESQEQGTTESFVEESFPSTSSGTQPLNSTSQSHASRLSRLSASTHPSGKETRPQASTEALLRRFEDFLGGAVDQDEDDDLSVNINLPSSRRDDSTTVPKRRIRRLPLTPPDQDDPDQNTPSSPTAVNVRSSAPRESSPPSASVSRRRISFAPDDDDSDDLGTFTRGLEPRAHRYADELRKEREEERRRRSNKENRPALSDDDDDEDQTHIFFRSQYRSRNRISNNPLPIDIQGDPESSEPEVMVQSDNNQDDEDDVILISSDEDANSDNSLLSWSDHGYQAGYSSVQRRIQEHGEGGVQHGDLVDDHALEGDWSSDGAGHRNKRAPRDHSRTSENVVREGDLIDRMLQRTQPITAGLLNRTGKSKSASHIRSATRHGQSGTQKKPIMTLSTTEVLKRRKRSRNGGHGRSKKLVQSRLKVSPTDKMDATPKVAATQGAPRMVYGKSNNKAANSHKPRHTSSNQPAFVFSTDAQEVVARHPRPSSGVGPSVPRTLHVTPLSRTPNISHPSEHSAPHPPPIRVDDEMVNTAKLMRRRQNLLDYGYASPPSQAKFSKESYLRKGWLVDLVTLLKDDVSHRRPIAVGDLDASMTLSDFDDRVPAIFDELHDWTKGLNDVPEARAKMRFMCLYVSWISQQPSLNDDMNRVSAMIDDATMHLLRRLDLEGDAKADSEENMLWVAWFALEISLRLWRIRHCQDPIFSGAPLASKTPADLALVFLLQRLHRFGFDRTMDCVNRCDDVSEESQFECASAELWICLIHLTHALYPNDPSSFWDQLRSSHLHSHCAKVSLQSSECVWKSIFTVLAISRFSMTGVVLSESHIQPSWSIVTFGLSSVRLKVDVEEDHRLPSDIVKSRDVYHRLLLSRCWHLATHFKWSLNDPYALFKLLVDMFRSRSFGSLLGEEADFPSFIRHGRLETAFSDPNKKCTAIGLFIKLILRAAHDIENDPARAQDPTESANWWKKVKRLTNPLIPVGSTSFTKEAPPVGNELSKLYNRFSLAIAAIRLEHWNTDFRLLKAKDYQDFKKADVNSRTACIRALMQIGIVLRQQDKDVSKLMVWYGELLQVLLEEGSKEPEQGGNTGEQTHAKEMLAMLALQLLRALRTVLETVPAEDTRYPDPVFIENAQLDHILRSPFANDPRISTEIREYIFTFLQLRRAAVPARTEPHAPVPVISNNESQESDEFGDLALDFEDPYMHTLLGERQPLEWEIKDQRVAAFLKASLSPALFAYFQKHFDEVRKQSVASNSHDDQIWVECWVECIDVMARNHMKAWEDYQEWGSESLDRIPLSVNTNHLSLHFLLAAIRIDPTAYSKTKEWMITIWISSLGTSRHSSERYQYSHLIFEADGHNHPLLRNIDITDALDREVGTEEHRLSLLTGVVGNMASLMQAGSVPAKDQHFVTSGINGIIGALSLMKEEFIELKNLGPAEHVPIIQQRQARFSQDFVQQLKAVPAIWENRRISNAAAWSSN